MKENQSSLTAAGIAIVRAIESEKPAGEQVYYDPYTRFGYADWRGPGVWEFLVARERYIDDYLETCLSKGTEQLVVLGAGYDARAYRFQALRTGIKVFEVDHPATQAVKLNRLTDIFGARPAHVTYVPIDLDQQALPERLFAHGCDGQRKTLFIWQGVTQYLTAQAVDDTLAFVAHHSGPGSSIIVDCMDAALLRGAPRHGEVSSMHRYRHMSGEDLVFGIPMHAIESFLEERGFTQVKSADHISLEKAYVRSSHPRKVADGYAIASAVVRSR